MISLSQIYIHLIGLPGERFPFIFSAFMRLKRLSVLAPLISDDIKYGWILPEIIRLVKTAPTLQDVALRFHCRLSESAITEIARLDWSLLDRLQFNHTEKRPRIDLCVTGEFINRRDTFCPESVLDALAANVALMDLVKRGLVTLRSERPLPEHCHFI